VTSHDEQRVRNTHLSRITYFGPVCPAEARHVRANPPRAAGIPPGAVFTCNFTVSALPHPTERRLRGLPRVLRGQVLAVAPGTAWAVLVVPLAARDADHGLIVPAAGV
jgi:hypothetical protein